MSSFITLVRVENTKMWKRLSTKVMLLIMVAIVILASCVYRYYQYTKGYDVHATPTVSASWQTDLQKEIEETKGAIKSIEDQKGNDAQRSALGKMKKTVAEDQYRLDHDISTQESNSIWTKVLDFSENAGYGYLVALLLIIACTASVAGEFSEGTIKMAISRPNYRHEILSAKLLVSLVYGLELLAAALILQTGMFMIFYGVPGMGAKEMLWTTNQIIYVPAILKLLAYYGLDFLTVIFYTVLAFALSTVTRSRSIATGFSLFMLLLGSQLAQMVAIYFSWAKYFPFTMTNFSSMMTDGVRLPGTSLPIALMVSGIYTVLMGAVGYIVFQKRDI